MADRAEAKALEARTPGDWFDIYQGIVEAGVVDTMERNGEGGLATERLADRRPDAKQVRAAFVSHGLPITEAIEVEGGPLIQYDDNGAPMRVEWPRGEWIRFFWPNGPPLEFRGKRAWIAFAFIQWWLQAQDQHKQLTDPTRPKPAGKKRIIERGSPEWQAYFDAKRKDLGNN